MSALPQNYEEKIQRLLRETVDIFIVSEKGHGKTVMAMNLAKKITENPKNRLIVFESFPKWSNEFGQATVLEIPKSWITESEKTIDLENTWIRHETSYTVTHGDIISKFLAENPNCIFLLNNDDIEAISFFIYSVCYRFYRQRYDLLRKGYQPTERIYFVLEEAQNSLDAKILSSRLFRRYRKIYSEARNMGLYWILISQRIQDLTTYFRSRCSLAIGKIGLDDFDLKVKRMLQPLGKSYQILEMPKGSFYFSAIDDIIAFPNWQPSKPKEYQYSEQKPTEPQKVSLKQDIKNVIKFFLGFPQQPTPTKKPSKSEKETEDSEEDIGEEHTLVASDEEEEEESLFW